MIDFSLRRATNIRCQTRRLIEAATALRALLHSLERRRQIFDRQPGGQRLCDLGFANEARVENIRWVAEIAKLSVDASMIALCR
jgi:adenylylsulfate kinase-like enzyme